MVLLSIAIPLNEQALVTKGNTSSQPQYFVLDLATRKTKLISCPRN
jgi:hypothetical protein